MRSSFWLCLIALGVSVAVIRVSSSAARSDPAQPAVTTPAPEPPGVKGKARKARRGAVERAQQAANALRQEPIQPANDPAWVVDGYGESPADAEEDALRRARESVQKYIDEHYGSLHWAPSLEQLQKADVVRLEGSPEARQFEEEQVQVAHAKVELKRGYREGLQKLVLLQHTRQRQWFAAKVLGGMVALLLVCGGYLRLEEATRGYYTRLLRLAAFGTLVGVSVGLWLL
jgi:hypothetical protein